MKAEVSFYCEGWANGAETSFIRRVEARANEVASSLKRLGVPSMVRIHADQSGGEIEVVAEIDVPIRLNNESEVFGLGTICGDKVFGGVSVEVGERTGGFPHGSPIYLILLGEIVGTSLNIQKTTAAQAFSCTIANVILRELKALAREEEVADRV